MAYADSSASGYFGQEDLKRRPLPPVVTINGKRVRTLNPLIPAARSFRRSRRETTKIDGEGLPDRQSAFLGSLKALMTEWNLTNDRALRQAQNGNRAAMRKTLGEADEVQQEILDLIENTNVKELTDGKFSRRIFDVAIAWVG